MAYIGNTAGNRFVASQPASVYSGDGSTTVFTLEHSVASDEDILVSVDGVVQEPSVAYAVSGGTTLTFTSAPSNNTGNNIFVYYLFRTVATVDHPSTSALEATSGTFSGDLTTSGAFTSTGIDDNASSTAMTIDSSGNLLVGTTNSSVESSSTDEGVNILPNKIGVARDGGVTANFNRLTSDGDIIKFRKDGTAVGSVGTENGHLHVSSGDTGLKIHSGVDAVIPSNGSSSRDAAVDLGYATGGRFKDLYLSGGVYLGGTGSANKLEDFESGSFTPTYTASTSNPTVTYSIQSGFYVKVGKLVHIQGRIRINSVSGGSGALFVSGLPFSNISDTQAFANFNIGYSSGWNTNHPISSYIAPGNNYIHLIRFNTTSAISARNTTIQVSDMNNAANQCDVMFSGTYMTNA